MESVVQNGWDQLTHHYVASIALTILYYDYLLTLGREWRLLWKRNNLRRWGSIFFFLNRYCGIIGHVPVFVEIFVSQDSALCRYMHAYHQALAVLMQTTIAATFVTRTYVLYDKNRLVLFGLIAMTLAGIGAGGFLITQGGQHPVVPQLPEEATGCRTGLSRAQAWRLAVVWCSVMVFDLVVVLLTLVRVIILNRGTGGSHTLTELLVRDGVVYFGIISLVSLANIITFLYGSEITRGAATTVANALSCVLVSRLAINLREPREYSVRLDPQPPILLRMWRRRHPTPHLQETEAGTSTRGRDVRFAESSKRICSRC